jgi:hypothetical protein
VESPLEVDIRHGLSRLKDMVQVQDRSAGLQTGFRTIQSE